MADNVSVETANGKAQLVVGASGKPKKDHKRKPGESGKDYLERMREEAIQRPGPGETPADKAADLQDMRSAIQSDPDYNAWRQNISPDAYNNPTSFPGVSKNDLLSSGNNGMEGAMSTAKTGMYNFAGSDGNVYSGDANSGVSQPSGLQGTMAAMSSQYGRWSNSPDPQWASESAVNPAAGPYSDAQEGMGLGHAMNAGGRPTGPKKGPPEEEQKPKQGVAVIKGEPISVASGEYVETWKDFLVPGTIPLSGARYMATQAPRPEGWVGPLGPCQISAFDEVIACSEERELVYYDVKGNRVAFERPFNFLASRNESFPHLELRAPWLKQLALRDRWITRHFTQYPDRIYRLTALEDRSGNRAELRRTELGWLTRIDGPDGLSLRFDNDAEGRRTGVTLIGTDGSEMQLCRYTYDVRGRMTSARCTAGPSVRYAWLLDRDLLASWNDPAGRSETRFTYDDDGRVVHTATSGIWNDDRFVYDRAERRTRYVPAGDEARAESFSYDEAENVTSCTDALGNVTTYAYDEKGQRTRATNPLGATTEASYDAFGNIDCLTDAEGRRVRYRWDAGGALSMIVDGEGHRRTFEHDGAKLTLARDALGNETRFEHDDRGNVVAVIGPDGAAERRVYDAWNRLTERHDARGGVTRYGHDAYGRCVSIEDAQGGVTRLAYEGGAGGLDVPTRVTRPDGVTISRRFDGAGMVAEVTDGASRSWRYEHGAFGLLRSITDPSGARLTMTHDSEGRVEAVTNAKGCVYRFERDVAGRVVAEVDFDGRRTTYARDAAGRVTETTLPDGGKLKHAYDRSGLLTRLAAYQPNESHACETLTYAYDRRGLRIEAASRAGTVKFVRDANGRVVKETCNGRTVEHVLDPQGHRIERRIGEGLVRYARDPLGLVASITIRDHQPLGFARDGLGRETRRSTPEGFWLEHAFDAGGRLASQRGAGVGRDFGWNDADALVSVRGGLWGDVLFERDAAGQIVRAARGDGFVESFAYDAAHNVVSSGGSSPPDATATGDGAGEALPYLVWQQSRGGAVESARGPNGERVTVTYDACGRVVSRTVERSGDRPRRWSYEWDPLGRLAVCVSPRGERWTYGYDALGRRLWKRRGSAGVVEAGRAYLWDGNLVAEEAPLLPDGTPDWSAAVAWHYEDGTFRPLAREEGGRLQYVVCDHLGTPRELADASGRLDMAMELSVWGARQPRRPAGGAELCPLRFQGQWADEETGLHYNRFRHYDPLTGQYASPDPAGLFGGVRPHGYVEDPTGWVDPLGLAAKKAKILKKDMTREEARDWLLKNGVPPEKVDSYLSGISPNDPINLVELQPGTDLGRYGYEGNFNGQFATDPGVDGNTLGINMQDRVYGTTTLGQPIEALSSTASDFTGSNGITYPGGGQQYMFGSGYQNIQWNH